MPEAKDFLDIKNIHPLNILVVLFLLYQFVYKNRSQIGTFLRRYYKGETLEKEDETTTSTNNISPQNDNTDKNTEHGYTDVNDMKKLMDDLTKELENIRHTQSNINNSITKIETDIGSVSQTVNLQLGNFSEKIEFLLKSDMEDKKAYITDNYNKYFYRYKKIDMYTLETLEKVYDIYLQEGGDSFVQLMMSNLRKLDVVKSLDENGNEN